MAPIETLHLFPLLTEELVLLLKDLPAPEWLKPSPIAGRTVKDLVSHLIDGSLRRLSVQRDHFYNQGQNTAIHTYGDLVDYIQSLNKEWIVASQRLSPAILIDLLEYSEVALYKFFKTLPPFEKAIYSVAWAGEDESGNWFDIAREYTEKWHHQMQIRMALNKPLLMDKRFIGPLYDTFMLGLPHLYNTLDYAAKNEAVRVTLTGNLNKSWLLSRHNGPWGQTENIGSKSLTTIKIPERIAWILFTNTDRNKAQYLSIIEINGNQILGNRILDFVTVMS